MFVDKENEIEKKINLQNERF